MDDVIDNFNEKVKEIEEYLKMLQQISNPTAVISYAGKKPIAVNQTAIKTMKASCFLMLYNLVESTIVDSMTTLYEQMNDENKALLDFDDCVKELWIEQQFKNMDPFSSNQASYKNLLKQMVNDVLNCEPLNLDAENLPISGNLDARKIRSLFSLHKISINTHYRAFGGAELKTIKDKRNALAHGSESFSHCGQQYSVQTIINIKRQAVVYLRSTLKNVRKYIEDTRYAA